VKSSNYFNDVQFILKSDFRIKLFLFFTGFIGVCPSCNAQSNLPCDTSLWHNIYKSKRLIVKEECKIVKGIIVSKKNELDGDVHIKLKLDSGQNIILAKKNYSELDSCIIIEPICVNRVIQPGAFKSCNGYINQIVIPGIGQHVSVTGSLVIDTKHEWMEIHPITKITLLE
jgi:hypothetical protein